MKPPLPLHQFLEVAYYFLKKVYTSSYKLLDEAIYNFMLFEQNKEFESIWHLHTKSWNESRINF